MRLAQITVAAAFISAVSLSGQTVRTLSPVAGVAAPTFLSITGMHVMPDGRSLISDPLNRALFSCSQTLECIASPTSDTLAPTGQEVRLIPFRGDSSIMADRGSRTFMVLAPSGTVVRRLKPVAGEDFNSVAFGDAMFTPFTEIVREGPPATEAGVHRSFHRGQAPLLREDVVTGLVDTVTQLAAEAFQVEDVGPAGRSIVQANPTTLKDAWALLHDGTIVVLRAADGRMDFFAPNHSHRSTPTVIPGIPLDMEVRAALVDSTNAEIAAWPAMGRLLRAVPAPGEKSLPADSLGDHRAGFMDGLREDADGRIWIPEAAEPTQPAPPRRATPSIYSVVTRQGVVVERVRLPGNATLIGFAPGVAYLAIRTTGRADIRIEAYRVQ